MKNKEFPKMTVSEAIKAGYEKCVKDGETSAEDIDDVDPDELSEYEFWILAKESKPYQISADSIKQLIVDDVINQTDVSDEDGELGDLVDEMPEEAFEPIARLINEKLSEKLWWPSVNILLVPD